MFYVKWYQKPSHPISNLWPELSINRFSTSAKHSVSSGRAELSSLQCSAGWGWGWVSALCCWPASSIPACSWPLPLTWWHLRHAWAVQHYSRLASSSVGSGWVWGLISQQESYWNETAWSSLVSAVVCCFRFLVKGESNGRALQFGHWLGAWVWARLQAQLSAHFFTNSHNNPDLSQAVVNKKVMKILLLPPQSTGRQWELMRCWVNCLVQDAGLGKHWGPGESSCAVAQTHTDTEHQGLPLLWLAVSSKQLLQLLLLKIRQLIVLHNPCLQVVHIWW